MDAPQSPSTSSSTSDLGIFTLPNEILHKIFALAVSPDLSPAFRQVLCSVSQHWRDVAIAYSDMWRIVYCDVGKLFPPTQFLELWIQRSHRALVDISFKFLPQRAGITGEQRRHYMQRALEILLPHCHRWKRLEISVPPEQAKAFIGVTLWGAVELVSVAVDVESESHPLMGIIATAPSIKYLQWETSVLESEGVDVRLYQNFPWEKLLRFSLQCAHPWEENFQVVARCTSVKVMFLYVPLRLPTTAPLIHLPNLRALSVICCDCGLPLIGNLNCPQLSVLYVRIRGMGAREKISIRQLCAFLGSGRHNLRMLQVQIRNQWLTEDEARILLQTSRELRIPSVDIQVFFSPTPHDEPEMDYSFLEKEFPGVRIVDLNEYDVVFGWLDIRAIDAFISEFRKVPDVDLAGTHLFFELGWPETAEERLLRKKVKCALKLFPRF